MAMINITNARKNLYGLVSDVNEGYNPITIVNNKGKNAVLISEDDFNSIQETLYLTSIPGYVDSVKEAFREDKSKCSIYKKGEKW